MNSSSISALEILQENTTKYSRRISRGLTKAVDNPNTPEEEVSLSHQLRWIRNRAQKKNEENKKKRENIKAKPFKSKGILAL